MKIVSGVARVSQRNRMVPSAAYVLPKSVSMSGAPMLSTTAAGMMSSAMWRRMSRLYRPMLARSPAASAVKESVIPLARSPSVMATCHAKKK